MESTCFIRVVIGYILVFLGYTLIIRPRAKLLFGIPGVLNIHPSSEQLVFLNNKEIRGFVFFQRK